MTNETPNPICGSLTCTSDMPNHGHLSMPNPCPHISRLELIAARLNNAPELDTFLSHLENCDGG